MKQLSQRITDLCAMDFLRVPPMPGTQFLSSNMTGYYSYHLQTGGITACFRYGATKSRSLISGCEKTHILITSYQMIEQVINKDTPSSSSHPGSKVDGSSEKWPHTTLRYAELYFNEDNSSKALGIAVVELF